MDQAPVFTFLRRLRPTRAYLLAISLLLFIYFLAYNRQQGYGILREMLPAYGELPVEVFVDPKPLPKNLTTAKSAFSTKMVSNNSKPGKVKSKLKGGISDPDLTYTWYNGSELLIGRKFNVSHSLLDSMGLPIQTNFTKLTHSNVRDFVFVTATNKGHFIESIDAIARVQKFMPNYTIIYYDLGLKEEQIAQLKSWCNVIYRVFNYSKYPKHARELKETYSFKPIIVSEILQTYPGLMWMDASYRLKKSDLGPVYDLVVANGGVAQFHHSPHSNYAATYPTMWEQLVTDPERLKKVNMMGANSILVYKTEKVYKGILHWWIMCALDRQCVSPQGSNKGCPHTKDMQGYHYFRCHRQDQSAFGTLIANLYNFDVSEYAPDDSNHYVGLTKTALIREFPDAKVCH